MIHDILHHALAGAVVALPFASPRKSLLYILIGAAAALLPDVTKVLLADPWLHSLAAAPFAAALCAGLLKAWFRDESLPRLFAALLAAIVFGHQLLDLIDNGSAIFHPFIEDELEFSVVSKTTPLIWITALAAIAAGLIFGRTRLFSAAGILVILLFIGYQSAAKAMVTEALRERYPIPGAELVVFPVGEWPWDRSAWSWLLRAESFTAAGDSSSAGGFIHPHHFYYMPSGEGLRYRVEEWTGTDEGFVIRCSDEQDGRTVSFASADGIHWRPAD